MNINMLCRAAKLEVPALIMREIVAHTEGEDRHKLLNIPRPVLRRILTELDIPTAEWGRVYVLCKWMNRLNIIVEGINNGTANAEGN